jgi:hypothetical protein
MIKRYFYFSINIIKKLEKSGDEVGEVSKNLDKIEE